MGSGPRVTTGRDGRFRFALVAEADGESKRWLLIREPWEDKGRNLHGAAATLDLSKKFEPGVHDLGDVMLHRPGSRRWLHTLTNAELERLYLEAEQGHSFSENAPHDADTCLTEVIERGGARWQAFLAKELATTSKSRQEAGQRFANFGFPDEEDEHPPAPTDVEESAGAVPLDVTLLTVLRRIEKKADPCTLEIVGGSIIEVTFPDDPTLRCRLRNRDVESKTVSFSDLGYESACRVEARAPDGTVVGPVDEQRLVLNRGGRRFETLAPGKSRESSVSLGHLVQLRRTGDHRVRLFSCDGVEFDETRGALDGWICTTSDEFTIRVVARPIELPPSERRRLHALFDAIDVASPPLLVSEALLADEHDWIGPPATPDDELCRTGWHAVPVLLDVLDEKNASPERRAWALALLTDITGLVGFGGFFATGDDTLIGAVGRHRAFWLWPSARPRANQLRENDKRLAGPPHPDPKLQAELAHRWLEFRECLAVSE